MDKKMTRAARRRKQRNRRILLTVALMMAVVLVSVGGTIAWLQDKTDAVENTFTVGNVDIELDETTGDEYKMVPGSEIKKDPFVTVVENSEACWLFVKIEKSSNLDKFIEYDVAAPWEPVEGVEGVYYIVVDADTAAAGEDYPVLEGDVVTVNDTVTKDMMDAIVKGEASEPTLTFTAYAIQSANLTDASNKLVTEAAEAWKLVSVN